MNKRAALTPCSCCLSVNVFICVSAINNYSPFYFFPEVFFNLSQGICAKTDNLILCNHSLEKTGKELNFRIKHLCIWNNQHLHTGCKFYVESFHLSCLNFRFKYKIKKLLPLSTYTHHKVTETYWGSERKWDWTCCRQDSNLHHPYEHQGSIYLKQTCYPFQNCLRLPILHCENKYTVLKCAAQTFTFWWN